MISRFTDLLLAFPFLILAVGLAAIRGASLGNAAIAIGIAQIPGVIRVVRSETLRLKSLDFVAGGGRRRGRATCGCCARHILPNADLGDPRAGHRRHPGRDPRRGGAVLPRPRHPAARRPASGTMLATRPAVRGAAPWAAVLPGVAIMVLALAFNLFGDGLRDALDPKGDRR